MRIGVEPRVREVPRSGPAVTTIAAWVTSGSVRREAGSAPARAAAPPIGPVAGRCSRRGSRLERVTTVVPNRSLRSTSTTMITKIHSARTKPRRRATRVSSLIGRSPADRAGAGKQHGQTGAADLEQRAVLERDGRADPLAVHEGAVGGAEVGGDQGARLVRAQLEVVAGDARVLEDDVRVAAAADHGDRAGEQVLLAVDLDDRAAAGFGLGRAGGRGDAAALGAGLGLEAALTHLVIALQVHGDGTDEHVALLVGVLHEHLLQLVQQRVLPGAEALEVRRVEVHGEDVRGEGAGAVQHLDLVVALPLEPLCQVERLQLAATGREDARHAAVEAALDPIQDPHGGPSLSLWLTGPRAPCAAPPEGGGREAARPLIVARERVDTGKSRGGEGGGFVHGS